MQGVSGIDDEIFSLAKKFYVNDARKALLPRGPAPGWAPDPYPKEEILEGEGRFSKGPVRPQT